MRSSETNRSLTNDDWTVIGSGGPVWQNVFSISFVSPLIIWKLIAQFISASQLSLRWVQSDQRFNQSLIRKSWADCISYLQIIVMTGVRIFYVHGQEFYCDGRIWHRCNTQLTIHVTWIWDGISKGEDTAMDGIKGHSTSWNGKIEYNKILLCTSVKMAECSALYPPLKYSVDCWSIASVTRFVGRGAQWRNLLSDLREVNVSHSSVLPPGDKQVRFNQSEYCFIDLF